MKKLLLVSLLTLCVITGAFSATSSACAPGPVFDTTVTGSANYGAWDGTYFWTTNWGPYSISKLDQAGQLVETYVLGCADFPTDCFAPLQAAFDGTSLWVGSSTVNGNLAKVNVSTGAVEEKFQMNPTGAGIGGIQSVMWDGNYLYIGVAQYGVTGGGLVLKFDNTSYAILGTATAQSNVNGLCYTVESGTTYVWAACDMLITKINTTDMSHITIDTDGLIYRVATDNTYIYGAEWLGPSSSPRVVKFDLDGNSLSSYQTPPGTLGLNSVAVAGDYLYTTSDSDRVIVFDKNTGLGTCVYTAGRCDVVPDSFGYVWNVGLDHVFKLGLGYSVSYTATPTSTRTATPTPTSTKTITVTKTPVNTRTFTATPSATKTITVTRTETTVYTAMNTPTTRYTRTYTPTVTPTTTVTYTVTATPTQTPDTILVDTTNVLFHGNFVMNSPVGQATVTIPADILTHFPDGKWSVWLCRDSAPGFTYLDVLKGSGVFTVETRYVYDNAFASCLDLPFTVYYSVFKEP